MILKEAVEIMKAHNEWRRGAETEMVNPKELGVAIDVLINHAEASQPSGGKSAEEIEQWYYKWLSDRNKSGIVTENVLDMLKDFAASQQSVIDGWVRVEDALPGSGQCVLFFSTKSGVAEGAWLDAIKKWEQWRWDCIATNVTHWRPLPEPPKQHP